MAQKGLGEGYVFFNKQRKKWNAQYRDYDINTGTLKLKTKSFKTKEEAKKNLNKNLEITSEGMAVIPTEWKTEILCYEFKGKVDEREFLEYINAENGKEEDVLVITNTPNGTLTE